MNNDNQRQAAPVEAIKEFDSEQLLHLAMAYRDANNFSKRLATFKEICNYVKSLIAPVAQPALPKLPSTPEEVVAFIDGQFDSMDTVGNVEDRRISLTVHDLLSCFQALADQAEEAQPAVVAVPEDWKDRLYAAMDAEFALRESTKRDADGQRIGMRDDDTQIGVEFAMRWVEQNILAAPQPEAAQGDVVLKAAVDRMQKAHAAANVPAKLPAYDEAFEYQAAVHALIKAVVAKEKQ